MRRRTAMRLITMAAAFSGDTSSELHKEIDRYIYEGGSRTKVRLKPLQKQNALKKRRRKNKLARKSRQVNFKQKQIK